MLRMHRLTGSSCLFFAGGLGIGPWLLRPRFPPRSRGDRKNSSYHLMLNFKSQGSMF